MPEESVIGIDGCVDRLKVIAEFRCPKRCGMFQILLGYVPVEVPELVFQCAYDSFTNKNMVLPYNVSEKVYAVPNGKDRLLTRMECELQMLLEEVIDLLTPFIQQYLSRVAHEKEIFPAVHQQRGSTDHA